MSMYRSIDVIYASIVQISDENEVLSRIEYYRRKESERFGATLFLNKLATLAVDFLKPNHSNVAHTGNQGAEVELQYQTAAFIVKPKDEL